MHAVFTYSLVSIFFFICVTVPYRNWTTPFVRHETKKNNTNSTEWSAPKASLGYQHSYHHRCVHNLHQYLLLLPFLPHGDVHSLADRLISVSMLLCTATLDSRDENCAENKQLRIGQRIDRKCLHTKASQRIENVRYLIFTVNQVFTQWSSISQVSIWFHSKQICTSSLVISEPRLHLFLLSFDVERYRTLTHTQTYTERPARSFTDCSTNQTKFRRFARSRVVGGGAFA